MDTALITEPTTLFAFLAAILGGVFWLSTVEKFKRFFELMPPVIWAYFLPMFTTTFGVTPDSSVLYDWMSRYLLPFSLFLLMITVDLPAILKLGPVALIMMLPVPLASSSVVPSHFSCLVVCCRKMHGRDSLRFLGAGLGALRI